MLSPKKGVVILLFGPCFVVWMLFCCLDLVLLFGPCFVVWTLFCWCVCFVFGGLLLGFLDFSVRFCMFVVVCLVCWFLDDLLIFFVSHSFSFQDRSSPFPIRALFVGHQQVKASRL